MDKMANGIKSEEFSGEKESSDQQRSLKNTVIKRISTLFSPTISSSRKVNTVKIGQLQSQQSKTPLSRKTHEQPANRTQEKLNSASKVSIPATKTTGKTSSLKEEPVNTQTSQPEQSTGVTMSRRSGAHNHKTSALQHGRVKTVASGTQTAEASTRCKKSSAVPETYTSLQTILKKRKMQTYASQSRPNANSDKPSSSTKRPSIQSDEPIHHIKWDGFGRTRENVGFTCALCEEDLSYMPSSDNYYESEYYDDLESDPLNYPEVAILECGHSFHIRCFDNTIPDEQCTDPPCVFCASYMT